MGKSYLKLINNLRNQVYRALIFGAIATGLSIFSIPSQAGGGDYCATNFSLDNRVYNECEINFPTLDTGNDTQTNLYLLLADKGLIDFDTTNNQNINAYYIHDFPLNLGILQEKSLNKVKNPNQNFLKKSYKSYHAEYCNSFITGEETLKKALEIDPNLSNAEREHLLLFRQSIRSDCRDSFLYEKLNSKIPSFVPIVWSNDAQPYVDYILATQLFYLGKEADFKSAENLYKPLTNLNTNNNPGLDWLVDTANYMLIRTGINRIYQQGSSEYDYKPQNVKSSLFNSTQKAINNYLSNSDNEEYVASARGLQRRLYWLSGDTEKLIKEIEWQINHPNSPLFSLNSRLLPEEIEDRIYFADYNNPLDINKLNDPTLITGYALYLLRPSTQSSTRKPFTLSQIKRLKPKLESRIDLYNYLLATYYLINQSEPSKALQYLPTDVPNGELSYSQFSQYALKARALQEMGRTSEANTLWNQLHKIAKKPYQNTITDLAIALQAEKSNDYSKIFGENATVHSEAIKLRIIQFSADSELLQQIAKYYPASNNMGAEARYALLTKSLLYGQYADFLSYSQNYLPEDSYLYKGFDSENDSLIYLPELSIFNWQGKRISRAINCQNLTETVRRLSRDPNDRLQKICLSEFMSDSNISNYFIDFNKEYYNSDYVSSSNKYPYLGDTPSRFSGQQLNRLDIYRSIFENTNNDELSAYALHRAIGCFASSGNNHCSAEDIDISVRKAWFRRLKSDFKNTTWAKNQKYYW